ncbi:hypothetical protein MTO96_042263, partial [Rhipicephalus appendiculatus]
DTRFPKRCTQKPKVGPCPGKLWRWWFNVEKRECEKIYYGGCRDNEKNVYVSQKLMRNDMHASKSTGTHCPIEECSFCNASGSKKK